MSTCPSAPLAWGIANSLLWWALGTTVFCQLLCNKDTESWDSFLFRIYRKSKLKPLGSSFKLSSLTKKLAYAYFSFVLVWKFHIWQITGILLLLVVSSPHSSISFGQPQLLCWCWVARKIMIWNSAAYCVQEQWVYDKSMHEMNYCHDLFGNPRFP